MQSLHIASRPVLVLSLVLWPGCAAPPAEEGEAAPAVESSEDMDGGLLPGIQEATDGLDAVAGLLVTYPDPERGKVWLELPAPDEAGTSVELIYLEGLTRGLGSNPVGLDRGQVGDAELVRFRRMGPRALLERPNLAFRALDAGPQEQAATEQSFATSVIWATDVVAESRDGRFLVDLTDFLVRDAHGTVATLARTGQGRYSLDPSRSALDLDACLSFPDNLEFEALLTFESSDPGREVRATAPDARSVTLVQHHGFVRLPDDGYAPREHDPRSGALYTSYRDYAAELDEPVTRRLALRHRLIKTNPEAERSEAVRDIVYYVDRGAPEPVRTALLEGARWWGDAFEAAGFSGAYRVELLPEGAHPLDVRYNVIQWVHRSTRGWSYGNAVRDPRTGEIIKGHVSLGSLRVRQDRLLFEGLLGVQNTGTGLPDDPIELALARIRQLSAHEVGHTLGFAHNFTASTYLGRASVMDYPAPLIRVREDGSLDVSSAYGVGIGEWDVITVRWLYGDWPSEVNESEALEAVLEEARARGMRYHSDDDARPSGASQPYANLWDNFKDPVTGLENALEVRRIALAGFGERNLRPDAPRAELEEVLAPVYFHHRYQVDAAVKMVGGVDYDHFMNRAAGVASPPVPAAEQRRALDVLLRTLSPAELDLPEGLLRTLAPRPPAYGRNRELFSTDTGKTFDALGAAASSARLTIAALLDPERVLRLVDQHRRDGELPSLEEVLERMTDAAFGAEAESEPRLLEIRRLVRTVMVEEMLALASSGVPARVRARIEARLRRLLDEPWAETEESEADYALSRGLVHEILRYLDRRSGPASAPEGAPEPPPGSPIGSSPPVMNSCCGG